MLLRNIRRPDVSTGRFEERLTLVLDYVDELYKEIDRALCSIDTSNMTDELRETLLKIKER